MEHMKQGFFWAIGAVVGYTVINAILHSIGNYGPHIWSHIIR